MWTFVEYNFFLNEPLYYAFTLSLKMTKDSTIFPQATNNLDELCDVKVMFGLVSIMLLLTTIHFFIKFAQLQNAYVCDFTIIVSICKMDLLQLYCD
jgi:hypothetical protein